MRKCARLSRRLSCQPGHQLCRHDFRPRLRPRPVSKSAAAGGLAISGGAFSLRLLADSLRHVQRDQRAISTISATTTSSKANSTAFSCGRFRRFFRFCSKPFASSPCRKSPPACSACGGASRRLHVAWTLRKCCAALFFRHLRRHHLHFGLSDSHHRLLLVRGPHRRASACLERDRLRPLSALDL